MKNALLFIFLFSTFLGCVKNNPQQKHWKVTEVKSLPIKTTNQAVCAGFINNKAYLFSFGGLDTTKLFSGIHQNSYRFDIENNNWIQLQSLPDSLGKIASAASRIKDTIYIIGGYHVLKNGVEISSNKVHRFDIKKNKFLKDGAVIPIPIDDQVQVVWKNKYIYVITGWSNKENIPNVQIYDAQNNRWLKGTSVPDNNIYKAFGASGIIIKDTIYYLGGAAMGKNFPIQHYLRKGVINSDNPTQIDWTYSIIDSLASGYRMAATKYKNQPLWIGGSSKTYNYNGIAYDRSGGVNPNHRILRFKDHKFIVKFNKNMPMDLRGIADINDSIKYIVGGIIDNQKVTNKVFKLEIKNIK